MFGKWFLIAIAAIALPVYAGCSAEKGSPVSPATSTPREMPSAGVTYLYGYYHGYVDLSNGSVVILADRTASFTINAVKFLNNPPTNLGVHMNGKTVNTGSVDIDIDISIKHPLTGQHQYDAYDMRGIFIGNGSGTLAYSAKLKFPRPGIDQLMIADPNPGPGNPGGGEPDGYTRWFNPSEFTTSGVFGYTAGVAASKSYLGTATLNPYKYFADGLLKNDDVTAFLPLTPNHGVTTAGSTNTRNYYIRFPLPSPGLKFDYAVAASWKGTKPADHPANAPEAVSAKIAVTPDITFTSPGVFSGNLIADVTVYDWNSVLTGGVMTDYTIKIEATVLSLVYTASTADMTPTASGTNWFTYHFSIPADNVIGLDNNFMWAIVQYAGVDYKNPAGIPNNAGNDLLAAFFRRSVPVNPGTQQFNVSMENFTFVLKDTVAPVGATVTWTNNESFPHTVTSDPLNLVAG